MPNTTEKKSVYEIVTEKMLTLLEQGVVPWHKPWRGQSDAPKSLVSGKEYRGGNAFFLHIERLLQGYKTPNWLTYKQAGDLGGNVRKGQKGTLITYWRVGTKQDKQTGKEEKSFLLRYYTVFNYDQCEGLRISPVTTPSGSNDVQPIACAEEVIANWLDKPGIIEQPGDKAFYTLSSDRITMPLRASFQTNEHFYLTLFHECTHATGAKKRLNRELASFTMNPESYSKEELVAEMGAAFLMGHCGLIDSTIEDSAAYIQHWMQRLRTDKTLLVTAAGAAQKAADYILGKRFVEAAKEEEAE